MRISDWSSDVCSSDLFELNVFKPLIGAAVIRSIHLLSVGMASFAERCVDGIEPNRARITELVERPLMLVTSLAPEIGYDNSAKIAKHAHTPVQTLRASGLELRLVDPRPLDRKCTRLISRPSCSSLIPSSS